MSQDADQNVNLTFSLPRSLKERIEALAAAEDRPVANFLRVKIAQIVESKADSEEAAR